MSKVALIVETIEKIPVTEISPSSANPRKFIDPKQLAELAESIKSVGIQVPLLLRIKNFDPREYEIVGGERRWRAAKMAELDTVPAIVREMSDAEARDAALIENLQREDLPPLDEADAYAGLIETLGSTQALAARVGKPIEYVTRRLKLRSLIGPSRLALAERLITIDHALLLAKLAPEDQEKALRRALNYASPGKTIADVIGEAKKDRAKSDRFEYWEPISVLQLKSYIEEQINLSLKSAPWDLKDARLVESAGPCTTCPSNTAANTALFGDLVTEGASCMDAKCFQAKKQAFVQLQVAKAAEAGKDVIRISWKATDSKPKLIDGHVAAAQVFKAGQWIAAKKGECSFVGDAIAIDDDSNTYSPDKSKIVGAKLLVCVAAGCKKHPKAWEGAKPKAAGNNSRYDPKAEEEKRKARAAAAAEENKIRLELAKQAIVKVAKLPEGMMRALLLRTVPHDARDAAALKKDIQTAPLLSSAFAKAIAILQLWHSGLEIDHWQEPDEQRKEFLAALKSIGVDGSGAWKKKPEPKASAKAAPKSSPAAKAPAKPKAKPAPKKGGNAKGGAS